MLERQGESNAGGPASNTQRNAGNPFQALGICSAFRDADFLAGAVQEGLAGQRPLNEALMRYERRRNEATLPEYRENIEGARFTPLPAEFLEQRKTVRGNQEATKRFIMALEGLDPARGVF